MMEVKLTQAVKMFFFEAIANSLDAEATEIDEYFAKFNNH